MAVDFSYRDKGHVERKASAKSRDKVRGEEVKVGTGRRIQSCEQILLHSGIGH